jgi:hypothetical protein
MTAKKSFGVWRGQPNMNGHLLIAHLLSPKVVQRRRQLLGGSDE